MTELMTVRLKLRQWRAADLEPFASLNADPVVIEFLSRCLTRAESDEFAERVRSELAQRGWGLWAVEVREHGQFIGFVGLSEPSFEAHFTPCTEIGWRLARSSWGRGYATEAARARQGGGRGAPGGRAGGGAGRRGRPRAPGRGADPPAPPRSGPPPAGAGPAGAPPRRATPPPRGRTLRPLRSGTSSRSAMRR